MSEIKSTRTDRIYVAHNFDGGLTLESLRYFVQLCDKAGLGPRTKVTVRQAADTLKDCGLSAENSTTWELMPEESAARNVT